MAKRTWKQLFGSRWFTGITIVLFGILLLAYIRAYTQNYHIQEEIKRLQKEAARLETKKIETIDMLGYVKSPAFIEEKARTELNLVKEGEHLVVVKGGGGLSSGQIENDMLESLQFSNPRKWWRYFFH